MPLKNRVDPAGEIHAVDARGMFTGNRGIIHDPQSRTLLDRRWTTKAWIICDCDFKGRKREVFGRNARLGGTGWTNLFFLDEVTALAAGHRPCFECRREKAREFADCFGKAFEIAKPKAAEIDQRLHAERWKSAPKAQRPATSFEHTPDGTMFVENTAFWAKCDGLLRSWSFDGYAPAPDQPPREMQPITPPTAIAVLVAGYVPVWHGSAGSAD